MSTIGSRIRQRRQELGISADELATKLGKIERQFIATKATTSRTFRFP